MNPAEQIFVGQVQLSPVLIHEDFMPN